MGNIEIRDQSNPKRRTQIFTDRKSFDAARSDYRNSLTQRYDRSHHSPIRFSKISHQQKQLPLTQRKPNTDRLSSQNCFTYSPIMNQESLDTEKSSRQKSLFLKSNKIKNIQIQENYEQQNVLNSSQRIGKIVSNSNRRLQQERKDLQTFKLLMNHQRSLESPFGTKEIIKKVRNFNDFLNQIKRKLKEDKQETLLRNKSRLDEFKKKQGEEEKPNSAQNTKVLALIEGKHELETQPNTIQKSRSMRKIEIALKLQNQKLELQKYRKLVERQLSKTHSIENISLCTKNSGQKILTIQYQSILNQNMFLGQNLKSSSFKQPSEKTLINKIYDQDIMSDRFQQSSSKQQKEKEPFSKQRDFSQKYNISSQSMTEPQKEDSQLLKKLKIQYQKMLQNVLELGKTIERYEREGITRSQVEDDKILIQEASELSQNENCYSRKGIEFSKKGSQIYQKVESQFINTGSQASNKQVRLIKAGSQCSNRKSKCSQKQQESLGQKNEYENVAIQFNRVESQRSQIESIRSRKESQFSKTSNPISKKQSQTGELIKQSQSQEFSNIENLEHTFNNESKNMLKMQNFSERKDSKEKIQRIESLFDKLDDLQEEFQETDREIRQAIGTESFSDSPLEEFSTSQ